MTTSTSRWPGIGRLAWEEEVFLGVVNVVCAGYVLAMRNLWIAMAKLMYCFDVECEDLKFDPFSTEFMLLHPDTAPFQARITPRTSAHARLIEEEYSYIAI
jgi:hypothetical protein